LDEYWEAEYAQRDLVDVNSAWNRLMRAIESVGHYSLMAAGRDEIQQEIDKKFKGNKHRSIVSALNQLLKFTGRNIKLRKAREEITHVSYVNEDELELLLAQIKDENLRLMHEVAFATGLRAGELFGLLPEHIKEDYIEVGSQIDTSRIRRHVKNRKPRKAYMIPGYEKKIREWSKIPLEDRLKFRKRSIARITRIASRKALKKEITFHALRHSYAIYLVSKGVGLTHVAQFIGDTLKVTERYYSGHVSTPESIQLVKTILKKA
jgi:integrase